MGEANSDSESIFAITENELTLLIISSIHSLKRNKKKSGRLKVYNLVKESVEFEISSDVFTETLNSLIENESVIVNTFRNCECISLPKENFQKIEIEKKDIAEQFHQSKNDFLDQFNGFKTKFLHEVISFKDSIINTTPKTIGNYEHIITLLLDNITFLKDQLPPKDKVIDSLINQFSKQNNYLFQKGNSDKQLKTNLESVKSKKESVKSKETEK